MVSILFVNWNCLKDIAETIMSIEKCPPAIDREYVIIDNGSDDYKGWIKDKSSDTGKIMGVPLLHYGLDHNMGYGCAANIGIILSHGKYVCLCNPDIRPNQGWLDILTKYMEDHSKVGMVAPASDNVANPKQHRALATGEIFKLENGDWVPFVCVLIPKTVFQDIGLVDLKYAEDVEFCLRLQSRGYEVVVIGTASIHHLLNRSFVNNGVGRVWKDQVKYVKETVEPRFLGE